nr:MAG TPA: hypothetical protein [Caudoviricetes sp.]
MLATLGDHDPTKVKAASFEVPDGDRVDRVDISGDAPKVVTSETPVSWQAQLEAAVKRSDEKRASLETRVLTMFNDMMRGDGADEDSEGAV